MDEAVCIASGPSLTREDCALVKAWQGESRGVVVVNNTYVLCPWADALYAMDNEWWRVHLGCVYNYFTGTLYSRYGNYGTHRVADHGRNSGAGAILLAASLGAKRILLLGYDCQTGERKHWHEDHEKPLGNCESMIHWPGHFQKVKDSIESEVINCSRSTALTVFPRGTLEDELYRAV